MKYAAVIEYSRDTGKIQSIRPVHRQYLAELRQRGQLAAAGPFTDDSGALIVYEADSLEEAEKLLKDDPFHQNGVFLTYTMRPWNAVLLNRDLFSA